MANNDRVTELYRGEIFTPEAQRICRDRIHWMCGQIRGERVLDIGCSQGITTILAAREGNTAVGVDVEEPAIEFAKLELAKETEAVRARVRFVLADIHADDLGAETFDTVILGEILEHQTHPRRLFERACQFLEPGGVIVAATPFGLHVHDDHKFTFYLSEFLRTVDGLCTPQVLDIADGYIRFRASHKDAKAPAVLDLSPEALLDRSEKAFLKEEWRAHNALADRARRIKKLMNKEAESQDRAVRLEDKIKSLRRTLAEEGRRVGDLQKSHRAIESKLTKVAEALRELERRMGPEKPEGGPVIRGFGTLISSVRREVGSGRLRDEPVMALRKTYARVRRSVKGEPPPKPPAPKRPARTFEPYKPLIAPKSSGLVVATILDTFSHHCFQYEAKLVPLTKEGWKQEMQEHKPALLFCESAWRGNDGQWKYLMTKYSGREVNPLRDLLAWCKDNGVPRVFWNKEDPANFDVFKDVARDFDYVFTTDAGCISRYKALLGHDQVYALPFAAQPAIHNPIQDKIRREGSVCFAGSWRADKYPERASDTEILLAPALPMGLEIFDRFFGTKDAEKLSFPSPYKEAVQGSLDYDRMLSAYRGYKTFLNVNSVKESPTMFSRRVFELLACGTPVVTSESEGIRAMFGSLVKVSRSADETRKHLEQLLNDAGYHDRYAHAGYRETLEKHTYGHRLGAITRALGLTNGASAKPPLVTILAATNRPDRLANLVDNVKRQIHPAIELIVLLNSDAYDKASVETAVEGFERAKVFRLPESATLAECLNHGIDHLTGEYVAKFDDDDFYGPHYLTDLLLATSFTDAPIIGKRSFFCYVESSDEMAIRFPGRHQRHVEFVHGATLFVRHDVFDEVRFTPVRQGTDTMFLRECRAAGLRVYSADPYNFVHVRHADAAAHTWQISDDEFLSKCQVLRTGLDMGLVMI
jgi:spore maturation protein CgeB/2-polyprenyl-3-methyl-5-hydroxy-6-metoxy-1,4-benzoquinol methylase